MRLLLAPQAIKLSTFSAPTLVIFRTRFFQLSHKPLTHAFHNSFSNSGVGEPKPDIAETLVRGVTGVLGKIVNNLVGDKPGDDKHKDDTQGGDKPVDGEKKQGGDQQSVGESNKDEAVKMIATRDDPKVVDDEELPTAVPSTEESNVAASSTPTTTDGEEVAIAFREAAPNAEASEKIEGDSPEAVMTDVANQTTSGSREVHAALSR